MCANWMCGLVCGLRHFLLRCKMRITFIYLWRFFGSLFTLDQREKWNEFTQQECALCARVWKFFVFFFFSNRNCCGSASKMCQLTSIPLSFARRASGCDLIDAKLLIQRLNLDRLRFDERKKKIRQRIESVRERKELWVFHILVAPSTWIIYMML